MPVQGEMRPTAILVVELDRVPGVVSDGWTRGPLPVPLPRSLFPRFLYSDAADQQTREQILEPRVHRLLFGSDADPARRHRWLEAEGRQLPGGWQVTALELLGYPAAGPPGGLLAIHVELTGPPESVPDAVATLANLRPTVPGEAATASTRSNVVALIAEFVPGSALQNHRVGYVISHVAFPSGPPEGLVPGSAADPGLQWSRVLALGNEPGALPGELRRPERLPFDIELSATWETCVLKNGTAFVGLTGTQTDPFHHLAKALVHSTYLDAILLGIVQRDWVDELSNSIGRLWEGGRPADQLAFEKRMVRFRSEAWWSDISETSAVNRVLVAFQSAHALPERQERLHSDIADVSRVFAGERVDRTNRLLNFLLVMSIGFGIAALVADPGWFALVVGLALAFVAAGGLEWFERRGLTGWRR